MTKYQILRDAFSSYADAETKFVQENEQLAILIVEGLRSFLQMPVYFNVPGNDRSEKRSYLPVYAVDEEGKTTEAGSFLQAISSFTDGSFKFAFGIVLERAEGAFPKKKLIHHVECKRHGGQVQITVSEKTYECQFDGKDCPDIEKVHSGILSETLEWLRHRPGDGHGFSKIGFQMR